MSITEAWKLFWARPKDTRQKFYILFFLLFIVLFLFGSSISTALLFSAVITAGVGYWYVSHAGGSS